MKVFFLTENREPTTILYQDFQDYHNKGETNFALIP